MDAHWRIKITPAHAFGALGQASDGAADPAGDKKRKRHTHNPHHRDQTQTREERGTNFSLDRIAPNPNVDCPNLSLKYRHPRFVNVAAAKTQGSIERLSKPTLRQTALKLSGKRPEAVSHDLSRSVFNKSVRHLVE